MTIAELHATIPNFAALFDDVRFKAAVAYLREHPRPLASSNLVETTAIVRNEGAFHGWFESLAELESLKSIPKPSNSPLPSKGFYSNPTPVAPQQPPPSNA